MSSWSQYRQIDEGGLLCVCSVWDPSPGKAWLCHVENALAGMPPMLRSGEGVGYCMDPGENMYGAAEEGWY